MTAAGSTRLTIPAVAVLLVLSAPAAAQSPPTALTPEMRAELDIWRDQLGDPGTTALTKRQAARLLLSRGYPEATQVLLEFLGRPDSPSAKIAVAEAIARWGKGNRTEFIQPLTGMLVGKDASVRSAAAEALISYKDHGVIERLIGVMRDTKMDRAVRLQVVEALQRVVDKQVVGALVSVLRDSDTAVAKAALEGLSKLTNVYGLTPAQWEERWREIEKQDLREWLRLWAENQARRGRQLEQENTDLRHRLAAAYERLYETVAAGERAAFVLGLLRDGVSDVRLAGARLVTSAGAAPAEVPEETRKELRGLLADSDARVREQAAVVVAVLGDKQAAAVLLERLKVETVSAARRSLLTAIGQLGDATALPAVLKDVAAQEDAVAAAAAVALAKLGEKHPLSGQSQTEAAEVLLARHKAAASAERTKETVELIEALLQAMGTVGGSGFVPVAREALKDEDAMIRLAAVNCIGRVGDAQIASALVPLVSDQDRAVRRAAIDVLGKLGGMAYLPTLIERTLSTAEPDPAVRQQARDEVLGILAKATPDVLQSVADRLRDQSEAADWRVQVLELLVSRLKEAKAKDLPLAQRQLGLALLAASRHAAAAAQLEQAYDALQKAKNPEAQAVWADWLAALLEAEPARVPLEMAKQTAEPAFRKAQAALSARLEALAAGGKWAALVDLADAAIKHLAPRLSVDELVALKKARGHAADEQQAADRSAVVEHVGELGSPEDAVRTQATAALKAMGKRGVRPLIEELKKAVAAGDDKVEKAILAALPAVAPGLKGYDISAERDDRVKVIDGWLGGLN